MDFKALVELFCTCGWIMRDNERGFYCENPACARRAALYVVEVDVREIKMPYGAAA
jgi:hypothetical protein